MREGSTRGGRAFGHIAVRDEGHYLSRPPRSSGGSSNSTSSAEGRRSGQSDRQEAAIGTRIEIRVELKIKPGGYDRILPLLACRNLPVTNEEDLLDGHARSGWQSAPGGRPRADFW